MLITSNQQTQARTVAYVRSTRRPQLMQFLSEVPYKPLIENGNLEIE